MFSLAKGQWNSRTTNQLSCFRKFMQQLGFGCYGIGIQHSSNRSKQHQISSSMQNIDHTTNQHPWPKHNKHRHMDFMSNFKTAAEYIHYCYHNSNRPNIQIFWVFTARHASWYFQHQHQNLISIQQHSSLKQSSNQTSFKKHGMGMFLLQPKQQQTTQFTWFFFGNFRGFQTACMHTSSTFKHQSSKPLSTSMANNRIFSNRPKHSWEKFCAYSS